jgi:hypothetical protein
MPFSVSGNNVIASKKKLMPWQSPLLSKKSSLAFEPITQAGYRLPKLLNAGVLVAEMVVAHEEG